MADYRIKLEVFEGPMAVLMHLIEKNKIDIYDIPILEITEQYLEYLRALKEFNIDVASEFLVMAATLLQIKSQMLLPKPVKLNEEEQDEFDPRQELVTRLLEYKKFKQYSSILLDMAEQRSHFFTREPLVLPTRYILPEDLTLNHLLTAFAAVWESASDDIALVSREEISIQDKMQDIVYLLHKNDGKIEFSHTFIRSGSRTEIIATFLALLELIKLRRILVTQEKSFAPIYITLRESDML